MTPARPLESAHCHYKSPSGAEIPTRERRRKRVKEVNDGVKRVRREDERGGKRVKVKREGGKG